jgi:hypothetical protein
VTGKILDPFWLTQAVYVVGRRDYPSLDDPDASGDHRGGLQGADAEGNIGPVEVKIDDLVGERYIDHDVGVGFAKGGEQGLKAENAEGNRGIDADRPARRRCASRNAAFDASSASSATLFSWYIRPSDVSDSRRVERSNSLTPSRASTLPMTLLTVDGVIKSRLPASATRRKTCISPMRLSMARPPMKPFHR